MKRKIKIEGGLLELNLKEKELTIRRKIITPEKTRSVVVEIPKSDVHKLLSFLETIYYEDKLC